MNEGNQIETKTRKPRRWGFWIFVAANVAGAVVAIPLLVAVFPLLGIWWDTRSEESFKQHQKAAASAASPKAPTLPGTVSEDNPLADQKGQPSLVGLTNNLTLIGGLDDKELDRIVARQFGKKKPSQTDPEKFDRDSSVFHRIRRTTETANGKEYFCYEVDLVDQNGNHKVHVDCFEKPDLDYERSMAALDLVNSNPQLKKIYKAFSHVLAEKSSSPPRTEQSQTVTTGVKEEAPGLP